MRVCELREGWSRVRLEVTQHTGGMCDHVIVEGNGDGCHAAVRIQRKSCCDCKWSIDFCDSLLSSYPLRVLTCSTLPVLKCGHFPSPPGFYCCSSLGGESGPFAAGPRHNNPITPSIEMMCVWVFLNGFSIPIWMFFSETNGFCCYLCPRCLSSSLVS